MKHSKLDLLLYFLTTNIQHIVLKVINIKLFMEYTTFLFFRVKTSKLIMSFIRDGIFQFGVAILMLMEESLNVKKTFVRVYFSN